MEITPFINEVMGNEVMGLFPTEMNNYHEPFIGGDSVTCYLKNVITCKKKPLVIYANIATSYLNISNPCIISSILVTKIRMRT